MLTKLKSPVDVQIELTQACNYKCRHCYNYWRPGGIVTKSAEGLSYNELAHIVDELVKSQVPSVTITGGEPFSRRNEVFALLKMLKRANIHSTINTNLSLLKDEDMDLLAREYSNVSILFSLLSSDPEEHERLAGVAPGNHSRVLNRARYAIQKEIPLSLNMVLMRDNLHSMESTARLAKSLGVRVFCATKALPNVNALDNEFILSTDQIHKSLADLVELERVLGISVDILGCYPRCLLLGTDSYKRFSHRTCVAGCTTATIGADGRVRACSHVDESNGNIFQESLSDIWKKMSAWRDDEFIPDNCRVCPLVSGCRGGCRLNTVSAGLSNMDIYADPKKVKDFKFDNVFIPETLVEEKNDEDCLFAHSAVFRDESFGSLVCINNPFAVILINHSSSAFLRDVASKKKVFNYSLFLEHSGAKNDDERRSVRNLFDKLIRKGFLVKSKQN